MQENHKLCKIIEEFSLFLLEEGVSCLEIKLKKEENKTTFIFICEKLSAKALSYLMEEFKIKRQEAIELYGWELIGQGDLDNELSIVSSLLNYMTFYERDNRTYFNLVRYE